MSAPPSKPPSAPAPVPRAVPTPTSPATPGADPRPAPQATLRRAAATDLDALLALERLFPGDRLSRRQYRHHLHSPRAWLGVVEVEGGVRGSALCLFRAGGGRGRLYSIVIDPAWRGRGLAAALLAGAEAEARRRGCPGLRLEVRADNPAALALYEGRGYRRVAHLPAYYEDGADGWRLERVLPDEVPPTDGAHPPYPA